MQKIIRFQEEDFKIISYFDADVRESTIDPLTGESLEIIRGDISGIEIYSSAGALIGCFDYVNIDNERAIRKIIEENW